MKTLVVSLIFGMVFLAFGTPLFGYFYTRRHKF